MSDKKYTDEEIIETLERCSKGGGCFRCAMAYMHSANCIRILETECLDLINRQKADIERLRAKVETRTQEKLALGRIYTQKLKTVKYEAHKEFAERFKSYLLLNEKGSISVISFENIDNLLKEMVGEEE